MNARFPTLARFSLLLQVARPVMRRQRGLLALCIVLSLVLTALALLRPQPIRILFDGLLLPNFDRLPRSLSSLAIEQWSPGAVVAAVAAAVLALGAATALVNYVLETRLAYLGNKLVARLRKVVFRHLLRLPNLFHDTQKTGDLVLRLTGDIQMIREMVVNFVVSFAGRATLIVAMATVMLIMNLRLAILALALMPLLAWLSARAAQKVLRFTRRQRKHEAEVAQSVHEIIGEMRVFAAYGRVDLEDERFDKTNRSSFKTALKARRVRARLTGIGEITLAAAICAVIGMGAMEIIAGRMSAGELLVFLSYQRTMFKPIRSLVALIGRMGKAAACAERVLEILETPIDLADSPDARPAPSFAGAIALHQVNLSYGGKAHALTDLNLAIEPGEILGVTGPSGSGKSSLCMLIPRLYDPEQGRVEIDGVDVRLYTLESLRSQIGLVAQDSGLFDLTVAENVSFGLADWTMDQVREACRAAEVEPDVLALRHGYDTAIGERGALLSGGQRRRLALARALIRSPRILILDEPFEGLDSRSAESIGRTILKLAAGRTIILVSHHDEHLRGCSRVIRMERGAIVRDRRIDLSREYGHG